MSSTRPRMPPSSRTQRPATGTRPRVDADQVAGAVADQRTAGAVERRQHQLAGGAGGDGLAVGGIDHFRQALTF